MSGDEAWTRQQALVDGLRRGGTLHSPEVEAAFRAVPRHLFLPDLPLDVVYRDNAIITKRQAGRGVSSSSQPSMMAIMLDQLDLHGRVFAPKGRQEIGEHRLHMLGAAADSQRAGFSGSQRAGALAERLGVLQKTAAEPQQVLAFGCQFDPAADPVK